MEEIIANSKQQNPFIRGFIAGIPIAIGYVPAAITFGLLAKSTGLNIYETVAMSLFVFAGAAQYMAINLIAIGTGAFEIIFTTFIVNIRHLLMSASVSEKIVPEHPITKALYSFLITDEVFAVTTTQSDRIRTGYIFGVGIIAYSSWVISSGVGHVIGSILPETLQQSMAIALYAMFIALLMPSAKKHRKVVSLAVIAAILNTIFNLFIPSGWSIILATLISCIGVEWIDSKGEVG